nr:hypothetical protein [Tanacetum cinerariifolium]
MSVKKTSFPEMKCSDSIVSEKIGDSSRMVTSISILEEPIKVANALSRTDQSDYAHHDTPYGNDGGWWWRGSRVVMVIVVAAGDAWCGDDNDGVEVYMVAVMGCGDDAMSDCGVDGSGLGWF